MSTCMCILDVCVCVELEPVCVWVSDCERACRWISIIAWCKMARLS